jgi:hypothetical protein
LKGVSFDASADYSVVIKGLTDSKAQVSAEKTFAFKTGSDAVVTSVLGITVSNDTVVNLGTGSAQAYANGTNLTVVTNGKLDSTTVIGNNVTLNEVSKGTRVAAIVSLSGTGTIQIQLQQLKSNTNCLSPMLRLLLVHLLKTTKS